MKKIFIDAGHGGRDSGAVGCDGRYEKNDNLRLALLVERELLKKGFEVMLSRRTDEHIELTERTDAANKWGADLLLSLHRNGYYTSAAHGVEAWVQENAPQADFNFAGCLLTELIRAGISAVRGVKAGNYHMNRESKMTSCLLELMFVSNSEDNRLFDENIGKYAEAIATAIEKFLSVEAEIPEPIFRVQVGAFKDLENARAVAKKLNQIGFPAIVVGVGQEK